MGGAKPRAYNLRLHRIVWVAHHGPTPLELDHINDRRHDWDLDNLNPVTHQENVAKAQQRRWCLEQGLIPDEDLLDDERPTVSCSLDDDIPF